LNLISLPTAGPFGHHRDGATSTATIAATSGKATASITLQTTTCNISTVTLDGAPTGNSVTSSTVIVTLEAPLAGQTPGFFLSEIIAGTPVINAGTNVSLMSTCRFRIARLAAAAQFRVRVTLKGHFIWTKSATQLVYLDGQAFGQLDGKQRTEPP
jgi:hypothetical protein